MTKIRKALTALGASLALGFGTAMLDGDLTAKEALVAAGGALIAAAAVYQVRNTSPEA